MLVIIDRFEKGFAICQKEDMEMMHIPKKDIPKEAKEGSILQIENDHIVVEKEATIARKKYIQDLFDSL